MKRISQVVIVAALTRSDAEHTSFDHLDGKLRWLVALESGFGGPVSFDIENHIQTDAAHSLEGPERFAAHHHSSELLDR